MAGTTEERPNGPRTGESRSDIPMRDDKWSFKEVVEHITVMMRFIATLVALIGLITVGPSLLESKNAESSTSEPPVSAEELLEE